MNDHVATLTDCFLALPDENLRNLAYHLRRGTPILCGKKYSFFADGNGGA